MNTCDRIVCVVGPTASGKTRLAVELAKRLDGEVVSCDSMQLYRSMDVGTAKPTAGEMQGVRHHMLDVAEPDEDFSVGRYVEMADACVQDILSRGKPGDGGAAAAGRCAPHPARARGLSGDRQDHHTAQRGDEKAPAALPSGLARHDLPRPRRPLRAH